MSERSVYTHGTLAAALEAYFNESSVDFWRECNVVDDLPSIVAAWLREHAKKHAASLNDATAQQALHRAASEMEVLRYA